MLARARRQGLHLCDRRLQLRDLPGQGLQRLVDLAEARVDARQIRRRLLCDGAPVGARRGQQRERRKDPRATTRHGRSRRRGARAALGHVGRTGWGGGRAR